LNFLKDDYIEDEVSEIPGAGKGEKGYVGAHGMMHHSLWHSHCRKDRGRRRGRKRRQESKLQRSFIALQEV
jgi:hypothetical protein